MTAPEPTAEAAAAPAKRSPGVVAAIVIVVVIVLVGGAFVVYKLTNKKSYGPLPYKVSQQAVSAIKSGDRQVLRSISQGAGTTQLLALRPASVSGFVIANCVVVGDGGRTRVCSATRPGGRLAIQLQLVGTDWKITSVTVGPGGLAPSSTTTTSTT